MIVNPWAGARPPGARLRVCSPISTGATSSTRAAVSQHPAPQVARMTNTLDIARRTCCTRRPGRDRPRPAARQILTHRVIMPTSTFSTAGTSPGRWKRARSSPARTTSNRASRARGERRETGFAYSDEILLPALSDAATRRVRLRAAARVPARRYASAAARRSNSMRRSIRSPAWKMPPRSSCWKPSRPKRNAPTRASPR